MSWLFKHNPSVFNIPSGLSFVDSLATQILTLADASPFSLNDTIILLPNNRSKRALKEAFLRHGNGDVLLLPTIRAIGDIEGEEPNLNSLGIPESISKKHRQLVLTDLILRAAPGLGFENLSRPQALLLANDLASLIDDVETNEANWNNLNSLVEGDLAIHWEQTIKFLEIITQSWPNYLKDNGLIDPSTRRRLLLDEYCKSLETSPPQNPIIAAGSTGTIPATSRLLKTIARLPKGVVVLPGLDMDMPDDIWETLRDDEEKNAEETHPQFAMKTLLETMQVSRDEVEVWPTTSDQKEVLKDITPRKELINKALLPAAHMKSWQSENQKSNKTSALKGVSLHVAQGLREEASAIALMMREGLETPEKRIALITANTQLARRVEGELLRWGIKVDKSAGSPLHKSPPVSFMAFIAEALATSFQPLPLLSLLKHPFMSMGMERVELLRLARKLEHKTLRGPRPGQRFKGLKKALKGQKDTDDLLKFLKSLEEYFKPFINHFKTPSSEFKDLLKSHIKLAESLASTPSEPGTQILWAKDEGIALSNHLRELLELSPLAGKIDVQDYPLFFKRLLEGEVVRHAYGEHPRLHIWGTLEGRLQSSDMVILGDLNEGSWPPSPPEDPWMSRPMRTDFGLPSMERRIGQSAHDFVQAFGTEEIILSRAEKIDGTPTVPSRWLLRLEALCGDLPTGKPWAKWQEKLTIPENPEPWAPPEPRPPLEARPKRLSVTNIDKWMKDPYALFAKYILKLRPLDPIDQEPGAAERGNIIHKALEDFTNGKDPSLEALLKAGEDAFEASIARPGVWAFWWPRFQQVAEEFIKIQNDRDQTHKILKSEASGATKLKGISQDFEVFAEADRIDQVLEDDSLEIIDYKTGNAPNLKQIQAGFAPQLPLEGYIAQNGGFKGIEKATVTSLKYWKVQGGKKPIDIPAMTKLDVELEITKAEDNLIQLVQAFAKESTPYLSNPDPSQKSYGEYNHLARVKEWIFEAPQEGGEHD